MINLELPKHLEDLQTFLLAVAKDLLRPISRKYDKLEHDVPEELAVMDQRSAGAGLKKGGAGQTGKGPGVQNGAAMGSVLTIQALSWGDVGLMLSVPGAGLGNAAIDAAGTPEQKERFGKAYAAMAITEPASGSDSASIRTTAVQDGEAWVLNGEKIFVTAGGRCDHVVVWATVDKRLGKAGIKSFVVPVGTPGMELVGLEHKLGIRASDTATILLNQCRIPKENMLGAAELREGDKRGAFGKVMQTFDNTRPAVGAMAVGCARAALDLTYEVLGNTITVDYDRSVWGQGAVEAELLRMEADWEAARLLVLRAAFMADNGQPNSMEASMAKAKAGRVGTAITLRCVELCGGAGYGEGQLLEKFARDSKILDIFEGTQQIQQLIVARRLLNKSSAELK